MAPSDDLHTRLEQGQVAVRSTIRLGGWLVRGADGYAEVRFEVDDIVQVVPIADEEAARFLEAVAGDAHVLELDDAKRAEIAAKTVLARHDEVLGPWLVSVRWGSTSEHQGGASFRTPAELDALLAACVRPAVHVRVYSRNPDSPRPPDRLSTLLDAVNDRVSTVAFDLGNEHGMLVSTPSPFTGHPYGLATFVGERVARIHMPFGATLLDALRNHLVEHHPQPIALAEATRAELRRACTTAGYADLLASHRVTLRAGFDAPVTFEDPADGERLATLVTSAFVATLELSQK